LRFYRGNKTRYKTEFRLKQELRKIPYPLLVVIQKGHHCPLIDCRLSLSKERTMYMRHRCIHVLVRSRPGSRIWNDVHHTSDYDDAVGKLTEVLGV
jgi:hypothetical protein